ncbi:MAG: ABC transporter permease [bacterium]
MVQRRIFAVVRKEALHIRRDKRLLVLMTFMPTMMLVLFGYVFRQEVKHIPTGLLDESNTQDSRWLVDDLVQSQSFDIVRHFGNRDEIKRALDRGQVSVAIVIPREYDRNIARHEPAPVQILIDGSDPNVAGNALNAARAILLRHAFELVDVQGRRLEQPIEMNARVWYNPDMKSINYMLPGLIGFVLQTLTLILTSTAIVKEKESGTLEQILVTPMRASEFLVGKLIPYIAIGFINVTLVLAVGTLLFKVPIYGSLVTLFFLSFFFLVSSLSLGLLISTIANNQQQAMQAAVMLNMPAVMLSGFIFPLSSIPLALRVISYSLPLTYFLKIMRGIILKGIGFTELWQEGLYLLLLTTGLLVLSITQFRKRL